MTTLGAALQYAQRGWRVVPILPGTKRPALNQWQDAATTSTAQINQWWKGSQSSCGVGIATGQASGIWVLDIDDRDALYELEREHGELPATLTSITGSGGEHQVYLWPADGRTIHNSASGFAPGIDVRGEGGQIVAPPTIHPNGNPYEWDEQCTEIAAAPEWLLDLICDKDTPTSPTFSGARSAILRHGLRLTRQLLWPVRIALAFALTISRPTGFQLTPFLLAKPVVAFAPFWMPSTSTSGPVQPSGSFVLVSPRWSLRLGGTDLKTSRTSNMSALMEPTSPPSGDL